LDTLITLVGVLFTLTTVVFGAGIAMSLSKAEANDVRIEKFLEEVHEKLGITSVRLLQDYEFYPHFSYHTEEAKQSVDISYFEPVPPGEPGRDEKMDYYRKHFAIVRRKKDVIFRRIFRDSVDNKEWIGRILEQDLQGVVNIQLAIIKERASNQMPLALSVQIVDGARVWLVAIATHGREREPRDVYIENQQVAMMMEKYYNRLWARSEIIFRQGQLTPEGRSFLKDGKGGSDD